MPAFQNSGTHRIIHRQRVIWIIFAINHQMASLAEQTVAIAGQMAQLYLLTDTLIFRCQRLDCLQSRLIDHTAISKVHDHLRWVILYFEHFDKPAGRAKEQWPLDLIYFCPLRRFI